MEMHGDATALLCATTVCVFFIVFHVFSVWRGLFMMLEGFCVRVCENSARDRWTSKQARMQSSLIYCSDFMSGVYSAKPLIIQLDILVLILPLTKPHALLQPMFPLWL